MKKINVDIYRKAKILVVGDQDEELLHVRELLQEDGFKCLKSSHELEAINLFQTRRPVVLILSYWEIEHAERFLEKLRERCEDFLTIPHRTLLLCRGKEAQQAFQLCLDGVVDDYNVSRPLADPHRLRLSIFQALNGCSRFEELKEYRRQMRDIVQQAKAVDSQLVPSGPRGESMSPETVNQLVAFTHKLAQDLARFQALMELQNGAKLTGAASDPIPQGPAAMAYDKTTPLVLVAEGDAAYRRFLKRALEPIGLQLIEAVDGQQALEDLRFVHPNLLLLDAGIGPENALAVLASIKTNPRTLDIPVMMLAGAGDKEIVRDCLRQGAADFIVKPGVPQVIARKAMLRLAT